MDTNRALKFQLDYLGTSLPNGFDLITNPTIVEKVPMADGIIFYDKQPCSVVTVRYGTVSEGEFKHVKRQLKKVLQMSDLPYAVLYIRDAWQIIKKNIHEEDDFTGLEDFFGLISKAAQDEIPAFSNDELNQFLLSLNDLAKKIDIPDEAKLQIKSIDMETVKSNILLPRFERSCSFNRNIEERIFSSLLGVFTEDILCRYTSLDNLFRTLSSKKTSMCSVTSMNDKSECYYVDKYLNEDYNIQISQQGSDEIEELNQFFILSCSLQQLHDKLFMWRMYGDEARGVCITFRVEKELVKDKFQLAKVSYSNDDGTHPALDFIRECTKLSLRDRRFRLKTLPFWKHFFKPSTYKEECEVRLLCREPNKDVYKWIKTDYGIICPVIEFDIAKHGDFPLIFDGITLGPKAPEKDTNASQLRLFKEIQHVQETNDSDISFSKIDNFR